MPATGTLSARLQFQQLGVSLVPQKPLEKAIENHEGLRPSTSDSGAETFVSHAKVVSASWRQLSLTNQFLLTAAFVVTVSMVICGQWLQQQIVSNQIQNRAESGSLYMQGFLAPHVSDIANNPHISADDGKELDKLLRTTNLADRLEGIRIWRRDGTVIYSTAKELVGRKVTSADVARAFAGEIVAQIEHKPDDEHEVSRAYPLIEIYAPIYAPNTSKIIAVGEFYEQAEQFLQRLATAQTNAWIVVGTTTAIMLGLLYLIVRKGNDVIERQREILSTQLASERELADRNRRLSATALRLRNGASQANEQLLNRIGSDLHDGPVQLLTLLILNLGKVKEAIAASKASSLAKQVLTELRELSNNLVLPDIDEASLDEAVRIAIERHELLTGTSVRAELGELPQQVDRSLRTLLFRVIQEGLNNAFKHAEGKEQLVSVNSDGKIIKVAVTDAGPGPRQEQRRAGHAHPLGLQGLRNRVEMFGGRVELKPREPVGAELTVEIPLDGFQSPSARSVLPPRQSVS
jgi:signal transduction histidine kinase